MHTYHPYYMQLARSLAENAVGRTAENPAVGCVIVKNTTIIGHGATAQGGRPHAETRALALAGEDAAGADIYVTLEPCSHTGLTPPCAQALINAKPARIFIAEIDPDIRVSGRGIQQCRDAGIDTHLIHSPSLQYPHRYFTFSIRHKRPFIVLKSAMTEDGYSAASNGDSQWITGKRARSFGHRLRARACGIMIGAETAIQDNPQLTCRIPGRENNSPIRIICDPHGRVPPSLSMLSDDTGPDVYMIRREHHAARIPVSDYAACANVPHIIYCPYDTDAMRFDMQAMFCMEPFRQMRMLLVEGGGRTLAAFMDAGVADELYVFRAPIWLGCYGRSALPLPTVTRIKDAYTMQEIDSINIRPDRLTVFKPV